MKTIKSFLIAATLISATVVSTLSAQQAAQPAPKHEFKVAIGDSVMIKRECQQYLTGERPSVWVWDKVHTVRQLGTKRFPDGVLLMNIYSWMCEDCLIPVNGKAKESAAQAAEEQKEEKAIYEQQTPEERDEAAKKAAAAAAAAKAAEEAAKQEETPKQEEPAPKQEEPAPKQEEPAPAADTTATTEQKAVAQDTVPASPQLEREAAKGDSVHSQQKFRHGYDRFTIGVRAGVASQLHNPVKNVDAKWGIGADAILDLQYAHYWTKDGRPVDLGIIVGLGVGYAQGGFKGTEDSTFMKETMRYTIKANVKETDRQLQLEVPVMFSLIHENGLFFNVGPKFMIPVYTPYSQSIEKNANEIIAAYDTKTGVTFPENIVTGQYKGEQPTEGNGLQFKINIMLTAELGYEWILKSGNSLGLGAYANYCVYNSYSHSENATSESLLNLTPPTNSGVASLNVLSATNTYAKNIGYFDVGVKLAYHFNFPKKRQTKDAKLF